MQIGAYFSTDLDIKLQFIEKNDRLSKGIRKITP
jgi:hypothetical protein